MKTVGAGVRRTHKTVKYDQFCAVDSELRQKGVLVATLAKNCDFEKGALRSGFGAKTYLIESEYQNKVNADLTEYGSQKTVFTAMITTVDGVLKRTIGSLTDRNSIYIYDIDDKMMKYVGESQEILKVLSYVYSDGRTKIIFCARDQLFLYEFPYSTMRIFTGDLAGACLFHERLFVATKHSLKYSEPMNIENFQPSLNGGGEIKFEDEREEIVWIENLGESIYVFFQYGIAKLTADGEGSEFVLSDIAYNGGRIIPRTVCVYEDKLVFASHEGIFIFDGKKSSKLKSFRYSPKEYALYASAGCVGSRYFLYYLDEKNNKRSVFVDLQDEKNGCECFTLYGLNQSGGKAVCVCDYGYSYLDKDGDLPKDEKYLFSAEKCDFGSREEKTLKYLSLRGVGNCVVKVKGRSAVKSIPFDLGVRESVGGINENGADMVGVERKIVALKGREFSFEIVLEKGCVIREMVVEYDEIGGVK